MRDYPLLDPDPVGNIAGMRFVTKRLAMVGFSISLVALGAPVRPAAATPPVVTQTIVGGGNGSFSVGRWPIWVGNYTSTSQLGVGHYDIGPTGTSQTGATFTRSDGTTLTGEWDNAPHPEECGIGNQADLECIHVDLTGSADIASAHLVLTIFNDWGSFEGPTPAGFLMRGTLTLRRRLGGYVMVDRNGTSYTFGGLDHLGDAQTVAATDIALTPSHAGYWIVNAAGEVFPIGDAATFGNAVPATLARREIVTSISATPTGKGYWLFTNIGRVLPFGDAQFLGDLHTKTLNGGIVGSIATPTGSGYYMVGTDGGVFAFGDATFRGSTGRLRLNRPVVGLVPTPDNLGYWLVASDGGVFSFNASFHGSMGAKRLNQPIVTMVPYDGGYLMVGADGGIFNFSKGVFFGSEGGSSIPTPIVAASAAG